MSMRHHSMGRAPNYTRAALVTGGLNLFFVLCSIWQLFGFVPALLVSLALNHLLTRLQNTRR